MQYYSVLLRKRFYRDFRHLRMLQETYFKEV